MRISDADHGVAAVAAAEKAVAARVGVINTYVSWRSRTPFPRDALLPLARTGAAIEVTWEPWDPGDESGNPFPLAAIASGAFDAYVLDWAKQAKQFPGVVYVRFAPEMNGSWYPWGAGASAQNLFHYVAAFRHVRALFGTAGATNVRWVWSPNILTDAADVDLSGLYPGDAFVDVIGIDGYNANFSTPSGVATWTDPDRLFGPTVARIRSFAPTKTLWINETGSVTVGGDIADWTSKLFAFLRACDIGTLLWFEIPIAGGPDLRITSSTAVSRALAEQLRTW